MATLEDILSQMYTQTQPLRTATVKNLSDVLGGAPASSLPAYAPNRSAIEGQYNVGLEQARSLLPRGGQLNKAILGLGQGRARAVSDLESSIRGQAMNQAAQIGFGGVPGLISGAGTADQIALRRRQDEQDRLNAIFGNIATGANVLFGGNQNNNQGLIQAILSLF